MTSKKNTIKDVAFPPSTYMDMEHSLPPEKRIARDGFLSVSIGSLPCLWLLSNEKVKKELDVIGSLH